MCWLALPPCRNGRRTRGGRHRLTLRRRSVRWGRSQPTPTTRAPSSGPRRSKFELSVRPLTGESKSLLESVQKRQHGLGLMSLCHTCILPASAFQHVTHPPPRSCVFCTRSVAVARDTHGQRSVAARSTLVGRREANQESRRT